MNFKIRNFRKRLWAFIKDPIGLKRMKEIDRQGEFWHRECIRLLDECKFVIIDGAVYVETNQTWEQYLTASRRFDRDCLKALQEFRVF